jgi:hypothetical protein
MPRVSVIIPSRNERFLGPTVRDLLAHARGDLEIVVVLDGYWPDEPLPPDRRVKILHRGTAMGMRPAINAAAEVATGDYLLKCDAHTLWAEGYDLQLLDDYHEANWVLTLRRHALDAEAWAIDHGNPKYPIDYHFLSYPYERPGDETCGLHGTEWRERRAARAHVPVDEEMSSQGSAWFMSRAQWRRVGPLDVAHYGTFVQEFQEVGCKTWLGGGAVMVTKNTHYAHLYKGKRYGRGYIRGPSKDHEGQRFCVDFWMNDRPFPGRTRPLRWLVERFWPVPGWPDDLDRVFPHTRAGAHASG